MRTVLAIFIFCTIVFTCGALEDYLKSSLYPCVQCLCHARSGCWRRQNCARYSIDINYWRTAGSLAVNPNDEPDSVSTFNKCMQDENCIVGTIIKYTEHFGLTDCNCDGKFDCKDRAAIHLFKNKCGNPKYGFVYASRFNQCAAIIGVDAMLSEEGDETCTVPEVE